jgi:hypothetical protein
MLEQKIETLTRAVEALTAAITASLAAACAQDTSEPTPVENEPLQPTLAPAPADEQSIKDLTLDMSRAGHRDAIRDKLSEFGVKKITDLASDDASEYYDWLLSLKGEA